MNHVKEKPLNLLGSSLNEIIKYFKLTKKSTW